MPAERLSMRKIKEVLRLSWGGRLSSRAVAHSCGIGRTTVREYLYRAKEAGLVWPLPEGMTDGELEELLFDALCHSRDEHGLAMLERSAPLNRVARDYSEEMARTGNVGHVSSISGEADDRVAAAGLRFSRLRENLARAQGAAEAHRGLMRSPAHRENILDPMAYQVGIGVALVDKGEDAYLLVTELLASRPASIDARHVSSRLRSRSPASGRSAGASTGPSSRWTRTPRPR